MLDPDQYLKEVRAANPDLKVENDGPKCLKCRNCGEHFGDEHEYSGPSLKVEVAQWEYHYTYSINVEGKSFSTEYDDSDYGGGDPTDKGYWYCPHCDAESAIFENGPTWETLVEFMEVVDDPAYDDDDEY